MNRSKTFLYTDIGLEVVELSPTEWRGFALTGFSHRAQ